MIRRWNYVRLKERAVGILLLYLRALSTRAQAPESLKLPTTGHGLADFIPPGYDALLQKGKATGDLNRDGKPDVVLRLKVEGAPVAGTVQVDENALESPPCYLVVLFSAATDYFLAAQSAGVMLCKKCGGIFGDPFEGLDIEKDVLTMYHYGGSSWRWNITFKYSGRIVFTFLACVLVLSVRRKNSS